MWPLCIWGAVILIESAIFGIVKLAQAIQRKRVENIHSYNSSKRRRGFNEAHNGGNTLTTNLLAPPVIETKFVSYGSVSANTSDSDLSTVDISWQHYLTNNPSHYNSLSVNGVDRHSSTPDLGRTRSASSASDKKRAATATNYWSANNGQSLAPVELKTRPGQSHRSLNSQQLTSVTAQGNAGASGTTTPPPAGHIRNGNVPILITPEITTFVTPQAAQSTAWPISRPFKSEGDISRVTQSNSVYNIDVGDGDSAESAVTRLLIEHQNSTASSGSKLFRTPNIV